ncbi:6-phosphofructokinase, partial [Fulvivirgaceae bacterium PWU5]
MEKPKKLLVLTGGGDCPGLNAVIRGVAKRARKEKGWEVYGSVEAFNGVFNDPQELIKLTSKVTAGIHVKGGTILKTTNKGNPLNFPVVQ